MIHKESLLMFVDDEDKLLKNKELFVEEVGKLLSLTREGIEKIYLRDYDTAVIVFREGIERDVNIHLDSYLAIIKDIIEAIEYSEWWGDNIMKRFMGKMPTSEIELSKTFIDSSNFKITIDAGPNGWTIQYGDDSSDYEDIVASTLDNFNEVYNIAVKNFDDIKLMKITVDKIIKKGRWINENFNNYYINNINNINNSYDDNRIYCL